VKGTMINRGVDLHLCVRRSIRMGQSASLSGVKTSFERSYLRGVGTLLNIAIGSYVTGADR